MEKGNCVICCKNCTSEEGRLSKAKISDIDTGNEECGDLRDQLPIIFLLRKFLRIPQETCSQILQEHGNPNLWINWCSSCSVLVERAKDAFNRIKLIQKQLDVMRHDVVNTVVESDVYKVYEPQSAKRSKNNVSKSPAEIVRSYIIHEYERPPTLTVELLNCKTEQFDPDEDINFSEAPVADLMDFSGTLENFNVSTNNLVTPENNGEFHNLNISAVSPERNSKSHGTDVPTLMKKLISQNKSLMDNVSQLSAKVNGLQEKNAEIITLLSEERPVRRCGPASRTIDPYMKSPKMEKPHREPFTTALIDDIKVNVYLPENLECSLRATTKRQSMVTSLLRHFHSVRFLRSCTLTGACKKKHSDDSTTTTALPHRTLESIIAVVRKLSPSELLRVLPDSSAAYKAAEKTDLIEIRSLIRKALQYFKSEYNDDGSILRRHRN